MKKTAKKLNINLITLAILDVLLTPFVFLSAIILRFVRRQGFPFMKRSAAVLSKVGLIPVIDHYYEPFVKAAGLRRPLLLDRSLPGINWNLHEQLELLNRFNYGKELSAIPLEGDDGPTYYYHNGTFEAGDGEYLYHIIRTFKPRRIVEIGSGFSTLMAINAMQANTREHPDYCCEMTCIEPYEKKWLEQLNIRLLRQRVEETDRSFFADLEANDILFIDSSHVIKPQGDVLLEYLEIVPALKPGVLVHIHDIFTPKDYPEEWMLKQVRLWNEQYLVEAFLSCNNDFRIIGALNYLKHNHFEELSKKCPILKSEPNCEPGSLWIVKN
jgi:predicted O-methyltransferase YrrM